MAYYRPVMYKRTSDQLLSLCVRVCDNQTDERTDERTPYRIPLGSNARERCKAEFVGH